MTHRSYDQFCALARTLDVVGERWTLLVVRELMAGPKRYSDVLAALPGIGTSLLAKRFQSLEAEGIVVRRQLPPPAASTVYQLTEIGDELGRALLPLVNFGARHYLGPRTKRDSFRTEWPLLVVAASLDPASTADLEDVYEFRVDGSIAHLRCDRGDVSVHAGPAERPDVVMTTDLETFVDVGLGRVDPARAITDGRLALEGPPEALDRVMQLMASAIPPSARAHP